MSKKKTVKAEVKATTLGTRDFEGKKGDVIEIPADEKNQSPAVRHALNSGNLVVVDLGPVKSEKVESKESEE